MRSKVTGGHKVKALLAAQKAKKGVRWIEVGFFSTARYRDGTHVAAVAAWNEFGTEYNGRQHVPERPFFRNAIRGADKDLKPVLRQHVSPQLMKLDKKVANLMGQVMVARIQRSITVLRDPPNAPITVKGGWMRTKTGKPLFIKGKGSSNPLIDTGFLRMSTSYRVVSY